MIIRVLVPIGLPVSGPAAQLEKSVATFRLFQGFVSVLNAGTKQSGPEITSVIHSKFKLGHGHRWHKRLESILSAVVWGPQRRASRVWIADFCELRPVPNHVF